MDHNSLTETYIKLAESKIPHVDLSSIYATLNIQNTYMEAYKKLMEGYRTTLIQFSKQITDSFTTPSLQAGIAEFSSSIYESTQRAMEVSNKAIMQKFLNSAAFRETYENYCEPDTEDDDYVVMEESVAKEYDFPETLAIPVGEKRVRISTDQFLTIFGSIIIPILFQFAGILLDLHQSQLDAQTEEKRIQIEEERNNLLKEQNQLLDLYINTLQSIDTSHSSQAETIESLKKTLPKEDSSQQ